VLPNKDAESTDRIDFCGDTHAVDKQHTGRAWIWRHLAQVLFVPPNLPNGDCPIHDHCWDSCCQSAKVIDSIVCYATILRVSRKTSSFVFRADKCSELSEGDMFYIVNALAILHSGYCGAQSFEAEVVTPVCLTCAVAFASRLILPEEVCRSFWFFRSN